MHRFLVLLSLALSAAAGGAFAQALSVPTLSARAVTVTEVDTGNIVFQKNGDEARPMASLTKLMSAMVLLDAQLPMDTRVQVSEDDRDTLRGSHSRLAMGGVFTREQLLTLALVASDNRAILALARTAPGGTTAFVQAMNDKARQLGLDHTRLVEPSGLSADNVSTAEDLTRLAAAAYAYPTIRQRTTTLVTHASIRGHLVRFRNTNPLVADPRMGIDLTKTGFINEAGRCLLVVLRAGARRFAVALLGAPSGRARSLDLRALHNCLVVHASTVLPASPVPAVPVPATASTAS
jgi:serine-type D-Ala-D-Ala endopeptidase (penicillin-binding protein 7)